MKTIIFTALTLLFIVEGHSQNQNVQETTKTTVTTVKNNEGAKTFVKNESTQEVQKVELKAENANTLNIDTKTTPVSVTTSTNITNPDGSTRTVDVDRSSYYMYNGVKYKLDLDAAGYTIKNENENAKPALLRKTSTNSYIFRSKNKTAIGYFDTMGNLVVEVYDDKSDKITTEKYTIVK